MLGQSLVQIGVVGVEEVGDRPIVVDDGREEAFDLALHGVAEGLVEGLEPAPVGVGLPELAESGATGPRSSRRTPGPWGS